MARPPKGVAQAAGPVQSPAEEIAELIGPNVGAAEAQHGRQGEDKDHRTCQDDVCLPSSPAKKEPSLLYKVAVVSAAFVAAVFVLNSMKLIYEQPDRFRYPLFITAFHQIFVMAVCGAFLRCTRRQAAGGYDARSPAVRQGGPQGQLFGRWPCPVRAYWCRLVSILTVVGPVAFFGATCIACANTALLYIYPSLHEMIQNLGPLWVILVGKVLKPKQRHNAWTYVSLLPVFIGGALCITGEIGSFSLLGIAISNLAALSRSLRLVAQERIFQGIEAPAPAPGAPRSGSGTASRPAVGVIGRQSSAEALDEEAPMCSGGGEQEPEPSGGKAEFGAEDLRKMDSLTLLYYTAPFNCVLFLTYSIFYEDLFGLYSGEPFSQGKVYRFLTLQLGGSTYFYFTFTGLLASVFNLLAFMQVELVGGFVCSMVSQLKTPANILVSWLVFGAPCTYQQMLGVLLVCLGLQAYNKYGKTFSASNEPPRAPRQAPAREPHLKT